MRLWREEPGVAFLLRSSEPAVRLLARRHLLGEGAGAERAAVLAGPKVSALLAGPRPEGFRRGSGWRAWPGAQFGFGVHAYQKWAGAHWRLVSLVELGIPAGEERAVLAAEQVLGWLARPERLAAVPVVDGLARRCASQEGNAVAVCTRLGMAGDERVALLARCLVDWQWPDGGWNCDLSASGRRSSFHESLPATWGLYEYGRATGDEKASEAARRAAELFLSHHVFRASSSGEPIDNRWLVPRYPPYWHYDILQALHVLVRLGCAKDTRLEDAIGILIDRRREDGTWAASGAWWQRSGDVQNGRSAEVVDWGRSGPNEMITLNALRVLQACGQLRRSARNLSERG